MRAIRAKDTTTPPSTGIAPPDRPVPAPRGTIGTSRGAQTAGGGGDRRRGEGARIRAIASVGRYHRHSDAAHPLVVLLVVERIALLAHIVERAAQHGAVDDGSCGVTAKVEPLEQGIAAGGGQVREERLSASGRVTCRGVSHGGEETH